MNRLPVPGALWELPTCPQIAYQILKLGPLERQTASALINLVRWDPAISVRILAAANRTKSGRSRPIASLEQAQQLLNDLTIGLLSLQFTLDSLATENEPYRPFYDLYWRQCRIHAITCDLLSEQEPQECEVDPFLAGLLFELDRLRLLRANPDQFGSIHDTVTQSARPWIVVQRELYGSQNDHPLLLAKIPATLGNAMRNFRMQFAQPIDPDSHWERSFALAEAMGDYLVFAESYPDRSSEWLARLTRQYEIYHGGNTAADGGLPCLMDSVRVRLHDCLPVEQPLPSLGAMLSQANRELAGWIWRSRRAQRKSQETIRRLKRDALRDPLTGAYNRRFLREALHKEVARCRRHQSPVGLVFVDVDGFKAINDAWGHLAGDRVLVRIAETLSSTLRQADILARYGGEEFVVLPMDPSETGIVQLAERLRSAVEHLEIEVEGKLIPVTVSVGCTLTVPDRSDQDLSPLLLAAADSAMYEAKRLGGNRTVFRPLWNEG